MFALSDQAITGWFTLGAALGTAIITGYFALRGRKEDRDASERQRQVEAADRRDERRAVDRAQWRDFGADVLGRVREFLTDPVVRLLAFQTLVRQEPAADGITDLSGNRMARGVGQFFEALHGGGVLEDDQTACVPSWSTSGLDARTFRDHRLELYLSLQGFRAG